MGFRELAATVDNVRTLKSGQKFCLAMIADRVYPQPEKYGDNIPRAAIFIRELCDRTELSRTAVFRHLDDLEAQGLIAREGVWSGDATSGRTTRSASIYALNLEAIVRGDFMPEEKTPGEADSPNLGPTKNPFQKTPVQADSPNLGPTGRKSQKARSLVPKSGSVSPTGGTVLDGKDNKDAPLPPDPFLTEVSALSEGPDAAAPPGPEPDGSVGGNVLDDRDSSPGFATASESLADSSATEGEPSSGHVEGSKSDREPTPGTAASADDWNVITAALPTSMRQGLPPREVKRLADLVRERVSAGWKPSAIKAVLSSRALPSEVRYLPGLVKSRLVNDISVAGAPPLGADVPDDPRPGVEGEPWSHELANGRVITRRDLDCGLLSIDFHTARKAGTWDGPDRMEFALAVGIERYVVEG